MRTTRRASIQVETIEPRSLLSTIAPTPGAVARDVSIQIAPPPLLLTGVVRGTAMVRHGTIDVGDIYTLNGAGRVGPMGQVNARGFVQTTSLTGHPIGTITLSNRFGVAEMRITGRPVQNGAAPPGVFNFEVTRATGRYTNLLRTDGVIELAVGRPNNRGLASFQMGINPVLIQSAGAATPRA